MNSLIIFALTGTIILGVLGYVTTRVDESTRFYGLIICALFALNFIGWLGRLAGAS